MKKNLSIKLITLAVCTSSISFATTPSGEFFKLKESGGKLPVSVTVNLCLNGVKKFSCQKYTVSHTNLSITTIPNHVYPIAGITHNTSGIHISGCTPHSNGFCIFSVSNTQSTTVSVAPSIPIRPAVGYYVNNGGRITPLSYYSSNNGQTWTLSFPPFQGTGDSGLFGIACDSTGLICTAIGAYVPDSTSQALSYYSRDGGQTWTPSFPPSQGSGSLHSVACDSTGQICTAVGLSFSPNNQFPLSYYSNNGGKNWTPSLPPFQGLGRSDLSGVACDSTGKICTAVGYYMPNNVQAPLTYFSSNGGKTWTPSFPPLQGSGDIGLNGIACDSTGLTCVAVGFYTSNGILAPLSYFSSNGGQTWTVSFPQPQGSGNSELNGVACDSTGQICTAVGFYPTNTAPSHSAPLSYYSNNGGKNWTVSFLQPQGSGNSTLSSVTCDSKGQICTAVGSYFNNGLASLSYNSNNGGKTWTPSFPPRQGLRDNVLNSVA